MSTQNLPIVSVILPILNEEPYLRDAVLSILSQDYLGNFEIVLAVGPSKDRTQEIADQLDLPLGTVKSRIFFARKELKDKLGNRYSDIHFSAEA